MERPLVLYMLAAALIVTAVAPLLTNSEPAPPWGNSGGDQLQPTATTVYPWPMYTYNQTHSSLTKSPSPDDASVYWFNTTGPTMYGSPTVAEGKVFIGMGSPSGDSMLAFHVNNGTLAWRTRTDAQVSSGTGLSATPAYSNGLLFFGADKLYALYANNGTIKWRFAVPNALWGSGTPAVSQGMVFIGGADRRLHALDQNTGTEIWYFQTLMGHPDGTNYGLYGAPAICDGYVYLAAPDGYVYKISLAQSGAAIASATSARYKSMYGAPVVYDGKVYIGDGYTSSTTTARFRALNATDLSQIWAFPSSGMQSFFSSAAVAYGKVFTGSTNGNVYALDAQAGTLIWNYQTGSSVWSSPAISDGKVFIGSQSGYFYSFNANQSGAATYRWRHPMNGAVDSSPAISDGRVCVGTWGNGGRVYCFGVGMTPPIDNPPTISLTYPNGAQDWTGGSTHTITWTMGDDVTPVINLRVYLNYTSMAGSGTIAGPITGVTLFSWNVPSIDADDVRINATVIDGKGLRGYSQVLIPKIDSTAPSVISASPTGAAVPLTAPIIVNFSETMDRTSVTSSFSLVPTADPLSFVWSQRAFPDDTVTINHATLVDSTTYTATVGASSRDVSDFGNSIGSDHVWSFTTIDVNTPPTISVTFPTGGESWTGGSVHSVDWTANDAEDAQGSLRVWVNYSITGGVPFDRQIVGLQGVAGDARPYVWTIPFENSAAVILQATVIDTSGASGNDLSPIFEIDSISPNLISTSPTPGAPGIPVSANVIATWSEGMNAISAESAFSLKDTVTWTPVVGIFSWAGDIMTFDPTFMLSPGTQYSANITTSALDDSQPGNALAATYTWTFTTATVADVIRPTLMDATAVPDPQEVHLSVNTSAVAQDDVEVGIVRLNVTDPFGVTGNLTMSYDSAQSRYYRLRSYSIIGTHTFVIWASDTSGNWNSTSGQFDIVDTTRPIISNLLSLPNPAPIFSQSNLSAVVTDNYQVAGVWVEVTAPDMANINQTMSPGSRYYFNAAVDQLGSYSFKVSAVDSSGNWGMASSTFLSIDATPPVIDHTPKSSWIITRPINITANVTDDILVHEVYLVYTDTGSVLHNVSMSNSQQDEYYYPVPTQGATGTLTYRFWAVDSSGNWAVSPSYSSLVVELVPDRPQSFAASPEGCDAVRLDWVAPTVYEDGSPLTDLAGFNVYRADLLGGPKVRINTQLVPGTTFLDELLGSNTTYYYAVRAVDSRGIESASSDEGQATTVAQCDVGPIEHSTDYLVILVALIVVIVVIAIVAVILLVRKKRREGGLENGKDHAEKASDENRPVK